jgi:hypothetical protein
MTESEPGTNQSYFEEAWREWKDEEISTSQLKDRMWGLALAADQGEYDLVKLRNEAKALGELQDACIKRYCGMTGPDEWREAVRKSPEGQRLIAIAEATTQSKEAADG